MISLTRHHSVEEFERRIDAVHRPRCHFGPEQHAAKLEHDVNDADGWHCYCDGMDAAAAPLWRGRSTEHGSKMEMGMEQWM